MAARLTYSEYQNTDPSSDKIVSLIESCPKKKKLSIETLMEKIKPFQLRRNMTLKMEMNKSSWHFLEFSVYQDSNAGNRIGNASFEWFL